jgi:hypothetical protein
LRVPIGSRFIGCPFVLWLLTCRYSGQQVWWSSAIRPGTDHDRHHSGDTPTRFASGAILEPPCPCCGHYNVQPLDGVLRPPRRDLYNPLFALIFRAQYYRADARRQSLFVTGGWRSLGIAAFQPRGGRSVNMESPVPPRRKD